MHPTTASIRRLALVALGLFPTLAAAAPLVPGGKGFADDPFGKANDPRIGISVSVTPNGAAVVVPAKKQAADLCGNYTYVAAFGRLGVTAPPGTLPTNASGGNQFLLVDFPFPISGKKARASILDPASGATSFLTPNVRLTDGSGQHVPVLAVIGGRTADGTVVKHHPEFPVVKNAKGQNLALRDDVLVLVADTGDQDLSTAAAFGSSLLGPLEAGVGELRLSIGEVAGAPIGGEWVVHRGDSFGLPAEPLPLRLETVLATKPKTPATVVDGKVVVSRKSSFVLVFSEPVVPLSVGVGKKWVKELGGSFHRNLALTLHPCDASPLFPNVRLEWAPDGGIPIALGFDVRAVHANDASRVRLNVLDVPKGAGDLTVRVLPLSVNVNAHPFGGTVASAVTSLADVPFDDAAHSAVTFRVEGE